jgi:uncharacterized protein involved in exopolysaccharide biosynthesis
MNQLNSTTQSLQTQLEEFAKQHNTTIQAIQSQIEQQQKSVPATSGIVDAVRADIKENGIVLKDWTIHEE